LNSYGTLNVGDHLRFGRHLNPAWDEAAASSRMEDLGFDLRQRAGHLSGGQRAQLALTLAVAKRPELLLLDEPVAGLDPLARREFLQGLMESVAEHHLTVVLSSHLLGDVERVCDYLIVLASGRVQLMGDVNELLATHCVLIGPRRDPRTLPSDIEVIEEAHTERQSTLVVRTQAPIVDPTWTVTELGLEDLVLAYLGQSAAAARTRPFIADQDPR
jgi:ABC-2 type transport system ATP-binding protein